MAEIAASLASWQVDMQHVRERMYRVPTPRDERSRSASAAEVGAGLNVGHMKEVRR